MRSPAQTAALQQGLRLHRAGQLDAAIARYLVVLAASPGDPQANHLIGLAQHQLGDDMAALASIRRALGAAPQNPDFLADLGLVESSLGRHAEAVRSFRAALNARPGDARTLGNLGTALAQLHRYAEAEEAYRAGLRAEPANAGTHNNLGNVLNSLGDTDGALACFDAALALDPDRVDTHSNRGFVLAGLGRLDEAIGAFDTALGIDPRHFGALHNRALALNRKGALLDAAAAFEAVLVEQPEFFDALRDLGNIFILLGRTEAAIALYERAARVRPNYAPVLTGLLFFNNYLPDRGPELMLAEARRFAATVGDGAMARPALVRPDPERRLRVGLVSPDFRTHVVARFLVGVLPAMNPDRNELFAYFTGTSEDAMTGRIRSAVAHWRSAAGMTDEALAAAIRADGIDILVDLSGHSAGNRLPMFAKRPAPIAVTWLGYFATTGLTAIDYVLCNRWVIPEDEEVQWIERPWRLPDTYLCFAPPPDDISVGTLPALAEGCVTFGSFNNLNKLSEATIAVWADVLKAVPRSRLLLRTAALGDAKTAAAVRTRFSARGVAPQRLLLEGALADYEAHLRQYNRVDIALDPFPYNGGTTSAEALWMGVPLLALRGDRYVAHMGESILHTVGMPDWIADKAGDYVEKAAAMAGDLAALGMVRRGLRTRFMASPLGDAPRFAKHLEAAFRGMWVARCAEEGAGGV